MRRVTHPLLAALAASLPFALAASVVAACASSEDAPQAPQGDGGAPEASGPADGGDDDAGDAGARDAEARTCSDQGFCHETLPPNETLRGVWGDGATVWAVSEQGDVLRWDGQTWSVHAKKLGALYAIWGAGPTDVWIGGAAGLFHGTGASPQALVFEPSDAPGDADVPILSIWGSGPDDVFAVGGALGADFMPRGRVLHRGGADGGAGWELDPISSVPLAFKRVWGSTASGTWIAGDDGSDFSQTSGLFARAPGESELAPITIDAFAPDEGPEQGVPGSISGAGMMADGRVVVMGRTKSSTPSFWYGASGDGGAPVWTYEGRGLDDLALYAVWSNGGNETWVAGDYGRLRSSSGGKWKQAALMIATFPVIAPLHAMWGTSPDDFWIVGRDIAIHRTPGKKP